MTKLDEYFEEIFGTQFDNQNWISKNDVTNMVEIEHVLGITNGYALTPSALQQAINVYQGETKKVLMHIKSLVEEED